MKLFSMKPNADFFARLMKHLNPAPNPDFNKASAEWQNHLPTLWLLGKTGAGKSTLVQAITGNSAADIGNGFQPCTMRSHSYNFPEDKPLLRFLDTRGLAEADYDATEDIEQCRESSHALIILMRTEDPEQSSVLRALADIKKSGAIKQLLLVHTGALLIESKQQRERCIEHNRTQVKQVWKSDFKDVVVDLDLEENDLYGIEELRTALAEMLPMIAQLEHANQHATQEERNFHQLKNEILWYSGSAGATDTIPALGLVTVPTIQAKMLHSLANQYSIEWDKQLLAEFIGTLGTGFGIQYLTKLGVRQLAKLIPVYGQTVGAVTAAALSFGSTFAIGRVACKYLYHKQRGESVSKAEMQATYKAALLSVKELSEKEMANDKTSH